MIGDSDMPGVDLSRFEPTLERGRPVWVEIIWLLVSALLIASWVPGSRHRVVLLRTFGAEIGAGVVAKPRLRVKFPWRLSVGVNAWLGEGTWIDNLAPVKIGANACVSQDVYLCTGNHDWSSPRFDLRTGPITIGEGAWIAARSVIGPGVEVGRGAVVSLGAVITQPVPDWAIIRAAPGLRIGTRQITDMEKTP